MRWSRVMTDLDLGGLLNRQPSRHRFICFLLGCLSTLFRPETRQARLSSALNLFLATQTCDTGVLQ